MQTIATYLLCILSRCFKLQHTATTVIMTLKLQDLIDEQKLLCEEFDSAYIEVKSADLVAVATKTLNQEPLVGLRKQPEGDEQVSWFIYAGELAADQDEFEIMTVTELEKILPDVLPYLALESGFRFMIDKDDYEDVWKEGAE
ncbi:hypothetical protein EC844_11341 [Acinetobacter calcoaceticus]|uniref:Imm33-like domain-containing protein n=1 Tax=Acinetobacter calcoaceticus TaxID=471 RepID=A0A4R1XTK5_ACICA|nr:hypothetical protein EC844_11341 [Acinetobacter calcoaceticus]